jgi:hypothetical protein
MQAKSLFHSHWLFNFFKPTTRYYPGAGAMYQATVVAADVNCSNGYSLQHELLVYCFLNTVEYSGLHRFNIHITHRLHPTFPSSQSLKRKYQC